MKVPHPDILTLSLLLTLTHLPFRCTTHPDTLTPSAALAEHTRLTVYCEIHTSLYYLITSISFLYSYPKQNSKRLCLLCFTAMMSYNTASKRMMVE